MSSSVNGNGITAFTSRTGTHVFQDLTPTNKARALVNNWHAQVYGDIVGWHIEQEGSDNEPTWIVVPIIMDERHPQYTGSGRSKKEAKENSALQIMKSGHC